jgi:hypothetical protein
VEPGELKCGKCLIGRKGCYWNNLTIKGEPKADKRKGNSAAKKIAISRDSKGKGKGKVVAVAVAEASPKLGAKVIRSAYTRYLFDFFSNVRDLLGARSFVGLPPTSNIPGPSRGRTDERDVVAPRQSSSEEVIRKGPMRKDYLAVVDSLNREAFRAELTAKTFSEMAQAFSSKADELLKKMSKNEE